MFSKMVFLQKNRLISKYIFDFHDIFDLRWSQGHFEELSRNRPRPNSKDCENSDQGLSKESKIIQIHQITMKISILKVDNNHNKIVYSKLKYNNLMIYSGVRKRYEYIYNHILQLCYGLELYIFWFVDEYLEL